MSPALAVPRVSSLPPGLPGDWTGDAQVPISVDQAFNGAVAANVIFALDRLGLLEQLEDRAEVSLSTVVGARNAEMVDMLLSVASRCGYIERHEDHVALTAAGRAMLPMRGYFTWLVGGYGELLGRAAELVEGRARFRSDVHRNEVFVALGAALNDRYLMADALEGVLSDIEFSRLVDLGSGSCERLCRLVASRGGTTGVGLDISTEATDVARQTILAWTLEGRVEARQVDVVALIDGIEHLAEADKVDTVMSFFLLHDLFSDERRRPQVLPRLRNLFPSAKTFIFADTVLSPEPAAEKLPVFSLAYELVHSLMGVPLLDRTTYEELFEDAGLSVIVAEPCGTPHSWLYVLGVRE